MTPQEVAAWLVIGIAVLFFVLPILLLLVASVLRAFIGNSSEAMVRQAMRNQDARRRR